MELTRRTLMAGGALLGAGRLSAATGGAPDWARLPALFGLKKGLLYMNAANIAPAPVSVVREYLRQAEDFHANPSFPNREVYKTLAETVRGAVARYVKADAEEIAILRNTSEANNVVAHGVRLKAGDEVLITAHNHPSNSDSWKLRAEQAGAAVVTAAVPVNARTPGEMFDSVAKHVTAKTRVIAVSHFTNITGLLYPVRELAELAAKHGAWMHVDGAQSFGWMNLNLHALGVDSFSGSMHKWPMGPVESGILYVRRERIEQVAPLIVSHGYWTDDGHGVRKFEIVGQRDDARLRGMEKTFEFLEGLGAAAIEARAREVATNLRAALGKVAGAEVRGSGEASVSGPVIKVNFPGKDLKALDARLWERHKLAGAMTPRGDVSGLRLSPHIYNTADDIEGVVAALRDSA